MANVFYSCPEDELARFFLGNDALPFRTSTDSLVEGKPYDRSDDLQETGVGLNKLEIVGAYLDHPLRALSPSG